MGWLVAEVALVALVCFLIGSVNPAFLVARALGHDLRSSGSGNPGATNAGRVMGPKWGVLVLVLDVAKAYLPTLLVLRTLGTVPALVAAIRALRDRFPMVGAGITEFAPSSPASAVDDMGTILRIIGALTGPV